MSPLPNQACYHRQSVTPPLPPTAVFVLNVHHSVRGLLNNAFLSLCPHPRRRHAHYGISISFFVVYLPANLTTGLQQLPVVQVAGVSRPLSHPTHVLTSFL